MKKLIFFLAFGMIAVYSLHGTAIAAQDNATEEVMAETVITSDTTDDVCSLTVEEIDSIVDERTAALISGNTDKALELTEYLHENGMGYMTSSEFGNVVGDAACVSAERGATFETVYSTYTTGGVSYQLMRIYVTPSAGSNLYKTGVTAVKNSSSAGAKAMQALNMTAYSVVGDKIKAFSAAQTVYDIAKEVLSATTTVKSIKASYTWSIAETCVFMYKKSTISGNWIQIANYSKVAAAVTIVVPTLTYGSNGVITSSITKTYSRICTPKYYNSAKQALLWYDNYGLYNSARINKVTITGIEGKTVKTVYPLKPDMPGFIT